MTTPTRPHSIRCRLSDRTAAAIEFSAQDGRTLAAECGRAFARYSAQHPATREPLRLELQVRPLAQSEWTLGWLVPMRGTPVHVWISAALLDRRPPDDWTAIWEWVVAARQADAEIARIAGRARDCLWDEPESDT